MAPLRIVQVVAGERRRELVQHWHELALHDRVANPVLAGHRHAHPVSEGQSLVDECAGRQRLGIQLSRGDMHLAVLAVDRVPVDVDVQPCVRRKVDLGAAVGRDNLETELFTIADLDRVWVDLAVSPTDLPIVAEGQTVSVAAHGLAKRATGKIVFISPMLDRDTHSARVVAEIANPDGNWRPGSLVTGAIAIDERKSPLTVPASAVQSIGKVQVVFVRTADGFEKRAVMIGQSDDRLIEILSGAHAGEIVAVTNTFLLKAEFMKSLAEE